jgi:MFS transporter, UMF1 family
MGRLAERLALERPEQRAWAMYDVANSAFFTTVITAVFPIYFANVAAADLPPAQATEHFTLATTLALLVVALLGPVLGAIADVRPWKKRLLGAFMLLGVAATLGMFAIGKGDWQLALVLFVIGNIGVASSTVFYDALLPHVARPTEVDRLSTAGYALGYLGGGVLLAVNLLMIKKPALFGLADGGAGVRWSFVTVAVWWLLFSLPILRRVPEPPQSGEARPGVSLWAQAFGSVGKTLRELRKFRHASLLLLAFLIYNDGISTIIRLATTYGSERGIPQGAQITAIMIVQFVGIPCSFLLGQLAGRLGAKRVVLLSLGVYGVISMLAYFMTTTLHFFILAGLVGLVQGGTQALSRSMFARMIPRARSGEFFGVWAVFEKFAGILGPAVFWLAIRSTGSSRSAILSIISFFVIGGLLLLRVNVTEGERAARDAER